MTTGTLTLVVGIEFDANGGVDERDALNNAVEEIHLEIVRLTDKLETYSGKVLGVDIVAQEVVT